MRLRFLIHPDLSFSSEDVKLCHVLASGRSMIMAMLLQCVLTTIVRRNYCIKDRSRRIRAAILGFTVQPYSLPGSKFRTNIG